METIVEILKEFMTEKQRRFFDGYIEVGQDMKKVMEKLGLNDKNAYKYASVRIIKRAVELYNLGDGLVSGIMNQVPTLEWTLRELKILYDTAKGLGDTVGQSRLLNQIMAFQNKFGEYLTEDNLKVGAMNLPQLMEEIRVVQKELDLRVRDTRWWEGIH